MNDIARDPEKAWARELAYQMSGMDFQHMAAALLEARAVEAEYLCKSYCGCDVSEHKFFRERAADLRRMAQEVSHAL